MRHRACSDRSPPGMERPGLYAWPAGVATGCRNAGSKQDSGWKPRRRTADPDLLHVADGGPLADGRLRQALSPRQGHWKFDRSPQAGVDSASALRHWSRLQPLLRATRTIPSHESARLSRVPRFSYRPAASGRWPDGTRGLRTSGRPLAARPAATGGRLPQPCRMVEGPAAGRLTDRFTGPRQRDSPTPPDSPASLPATSRSLHWNLVCSSLPVGSTCSQR